MVASRRGAARLDAAEEVRPVLRDLVFGSTLFFRLAAISPPSDHLVLASVLQASSGSAPNPLTDRRVPVPFKPTSRIANTWAPPAPANCACDSEDAAMSHTPATVSVVEMARD